MTDTRDVAGDDPVITTPEPDVVDVNDDDIPSPLRPNFINNEIIRLTTGRRNLIKDALRGRVFYNSPEVFQILPIAHVPDDFVDKCTASLVESSSLWSAISEVKTIVTQAQSLPREELAKVVAPGSTVTKEASFETQMYRPLETIFNHIGNFYEESMKQPRFISFSGKEIQFNEPGTHDPVPALKPDITAWDSTLDPGRTPLLWRNVDFFGDVKLLNAHGPQINERNNGPAKPLIVQCADYARCHMSSRPLMLFSVGILICGTTLSVSIVDRQKILISPPFDMFNQIELLVRVIRSLSFNLSIEQLGLDPCSEKLPDSEAARLLGRHVVYPSHIISHVDDSGGVRKWCTIGPPLWVPLTIFGRGTYVFKVREYKMDNTGATYLCGSVYVLKSSWRNSSRTAESKLYSYVRQPYPKGLVRMLYGGDVKIPGSDSLITTHTLMEPVLDDNYAAVLHRLFLLDVGRPLWEYEDDEELFRGLKSAIDAGRALWEEQQILHRDINPGNILLREHPDDRGDGVWGYLADLDVARFPTLDKISMRKVPIATAEDRRRARIVLAKGGLEFQFQTHIRFRNTDQDDIRRGLAISGNVQFLALEILDALPSSRDGRVQRSATHDVQSFIWSISYCLWRAAVSRLWVLVSENTDPVLKREIKGEYGTILSVFRTSYGQVSYREIAIWRTNRSPALASFFKDSDEIYQILRRRGLINDRISRFIESLSKLLIDDFYSGLYAKPSYQDLLKAIDDAIAQLPHT
ncbi:hypothetical protein D9613_004752 [Agrocybe pediades]|uniref:Protein kinase domain-containing protein n=1 Tax=Agrocybe pediades TaxID=84607 RepID=A0A8H4VTV3_9AGAR|nr:hypothetical protein D9613_004752 [Agrocybe pediades]